MSRACRIVCQDSTSVKGVGAESRERHSRLGPSGKTAWTVAWRCAICLNGFFQAQWIINADNGDREGIDRESRTTYAGAS